MTWLLPRDATDLTGAINKHNLALTDSPALRPQQSLDLLDVDPKMISKMDPLAADSLPVTQTKGTLGTLFLVGRKTGLNVQGFPIDSERVTIGR